MSSALLPLEPYDLGTTGQGPLGCRGQRECASAAHRSFQASRSKIQDGPDLFPRHIELLNDFVNCTGVARSHRDEAGSTWVLAFAPFRLNFSPSGRKGGG